MIFPTKQPKIGVTHVLSHLCGFSTDQGFLLVQIAVVADVGGTDDL